MAKRGRPVKYNKVIADEICERLLDGESLREICSEEGFPPESTVRRWYVEDIDGFAAHYAKSREAGWLKMAEELADIADNGENDWMKSNDPENEGYKFNGEHYQRSRLRLDTRKWILSKMLPKIYGERTHTTVEATVSKAKPVTDEQAMEEIAQLSQQLGMKYVLAKADDVEDDE
jgi:hypothetical protein